MLAYQMYLSLCCSYYRVEYRSTAQIRKSDVDYLNGTGIRFSLHLPGLLQIGDF